MSETENSGLLGSSGLYLKGLVPLRYVYISCKKDMFFLKLVGDLTLLAMLSASMSLGVVDPCEGML
jgi:hypothetical protein